MPDLEEQLRRYASALEDSVPPVTADRARSRPASRRRRRIVTLAAAAVALLMVAGVAVVSRDEGDQPTRTTTPSSSVTTEPPPTTSTTAPATRTSRTFPVVAFSGTEYLVWSGEAGANDSSQRVDGFAVDVRSGAVRPIPAAPIEPRSGATGVWTGNVLLVCCGSGVDDNQSAASWNPSTNEWRAVAQPPASISRFFATSVWTGDVMVVVAPGPAAATYDPLADRWTEVVAPRLYGRHPEVIWTGDEVVVWDSRYGSGTPGADDTADAGWRWAPGRAAWEPLPPLPPGSRTQLGSIGWTGEDVVVWGQSTADEAVGTGGRWRPGRDAWRPVAASPQERLPDPYNGTSGSQAVVSDPVGGRVLVRGIEGGGPSDDALSVYDPASDRWTTTEFRVSGFHPPISYADGAILVPDEADPIVGRLPP